MLSLESIIINVCRHSDDDGDPISLPGYDDDGHEHEHEHCSFRPVLAETINNGTIGYTIIFLGSNAVCPTEDGMGSIEMG